MAEIRPVRYDPKTRNLYVFEIPGIPPFAIVNGKRPSWSFDEQELHVFNGKVPYPGKRTIDTMDITINDVIDRTIVQELWNWSKQVYDPETGQRGYRFEYVRNITLTILGYKGEELEVWLLEECYPQSVQGGDLDMSSTEPLQITITLKITNVRLLRANGVSVGVGGGTSIIV